MKTRRCKGIFAFLLGSLCMVSAVIVNAADTDADGVKKEVIYHTKNPEEKIDEQFEQYIVRSSEKFELKDISYEVISKKPKKEKIVVTRTVTTDPIKDTYTPKETISEDGVTYTLAGMEEREVAVQAPYTQTVTGQITYNSAVSQQQVPKTYDVKVKDDLTGETVMVTCDFENLTEGSPVWKESTIDIVYESYDSDFFVLSNALIPKNENQPPLVGYEDALLQSVGMSSATTKIIGLQWNGEAYEEDGVMYRNAIATIKTFVPSYIANYKGKIVHDEENGTIYVLHYEGSYEQESDTEFDYEIKATAMYQLVQESNTGKVLIGSLLIILLAALIVLSVYVISQKNKENEKTKKRR